MADNTTLDPGTGGDTIRDKDRAGVKTPIVAIDLNPAGSETLMAGAMPVTNTGTFAVQPAANSSVNQAQIAGTATDTNSGVKSAGTQRVVLATDQPQLTNALKVDGSAVTQPVSGTVTANAGTGTQAVSAASLPLPSGAATSAKQPALGTAGTPSADVLTVQGVTSMTALKVDGSGVTQPVSGTVTATGPLTDTQLRATAVPVSLATAPSTPVTNAGTFAVQIAANSAINNAQVAGTAVSVNSGAKDAGTQRVILASDQTAVPVSAAVGAPAFVTPTPSTTGGWTPKMFNALQATKTLVKASAGTFGGHLTIYNPNTSVAYIQVFDAASTAAVTLGTTTPVALIVVPPSSAANVEVSLGVNMASGIVIAATTTATGSTGPTTGLDGTILYK